MWLNIFVVKILDNNVIYKFSSQQCGFRIKTKKSREKATTERPGASLNMPPFACTVAKIYKFCP